MDTKVKNQIKNVLNDVDEKKYITESTPSDLTNIAKNMVDRLNKGKKKTKQSRTATRTEAEVNWATVANKITVPNIAKGGITIGGGYVGSLVGAGFLTGLGFALGGPAGAVIGYNAGSILGGGAGAVASYKFGKVVADKLTENDNEELVTKGNTQILHESISVSEKKRGDEEDEEDE